MRSRQAVDAVASIAHSSVLPDTMMPSTALTVTAAAGIQNFERRVAVQTESFGVDKKLWCRPCLRSDLA